MTNFDLSNPTAEERSLALITHLCSLVATSLLMNVFVPVIIMCISDSPFVKDQAKEALNFQLNVLIWGLICIFLCFVFIGIPLLIILAIGAIVLPICASISVAGGKAYRYPLAWRLIH
jgi:uncharacterized Tic20 family protein